MILIDSEFGHKKGISVFGDSKVGCGKYSKYQTKPQTLKGYVESWSIEFRTLAFGA